MEIITGGVTAAKGFKAAAAAAEIKYKGRTDMAMVYSEVPCVAAGTFTTNVVKAAPVKWDQNVVYNHPSAQAVICNSGIANACTGAEGYGYCKATADAASEILGIPADSVLVASTGVIGMQIPIDRIVNGVKAMAPKLDGSLEAGTEAAKAIMTTDTVKKEVAVQIEIGGKTVTVGGMCKTKEEAVTLSKSVVTSSLTKAAIYGHDANWGRILCAMGYSGVQFDPEKVDLYFESRAGKLKIIENGVSTGYDEAEATRILSEDEVTAIADVKMGDAKATAWGCDLTYDYVKINADYRS